jgi:nitrite reductase/ring-hydroxylating ferredoxin subunit
MAAARLCLLPPAKSSVVCLLLLFLLCSSSSWRGAHAWISSTTTTTTTFAPRLVGARHYVSACKQPSFRSQPLTSTISSSSTSKESSSSSFSPLEYNWKDQWYALTYASHVPYPSESAEVVPAAVFGQPLVLWREQPKQKSNKNDDYSDIIYCATDACPHRTAALSEGRVRNGTLTCLYHGWQFSGRQDGNCVRIPHLETTASIPKRACLDMKTCRVDEGIVWVWMGDDDPPPNNRRDPPSCTKGVAFTRQGQAKDDWLTYDFQ